MKRNGAELPLCTWSGCVGSLNGVAVATPQAQWRWRRAPLRFVKMCRVACSSTAASIGRQSTGCCMWRQSVGCWMWYGMHVIWPCGGVRPRKMRVDGRRLAEEGEEGHGSPIKCALLLFCFRSCDSSGHEKTPLAHPSPLPVPLTLPVLWFSLSAFWSTHHRPRDHVGSLPSEARRALGGR